MKKTYNRAGIEDLGPAMELLEMTGAQLSVALGYRANAVAAWLRAGNMPEVGRRALTGLILERGLNLPDKTFENRIVVIEIYENETQTHTCSKLETIEIFGKTYYLIPKA